MFADFERIASVLENLPEKRLAIALSGGVDSVTLARASEIVLGKENVLLLFADSVFSPEAERAFALEWAMARKLQCIAVPFEPLNDPVIAGNPSDRCYHCKKAMLSLLLAKASEKGFTVITDGENLDDAGDYRPGRKAADELNIRHIFLEAKLNKAMIRDLAHDFALPNSQAPASACLASRIPCNTSITVPALKMVDSAEQILLEHGFAGARVRFYNDLAKIEVAPEDMEKLWKMRNSVTDAIKVLGFKSTALDLDGYRRGAVNGAEKAEQ